MRHPRSTHVQGRRDSPPACVRVSSSPVQARSLKVVCPAAILTPVPRGSPDPPSCQGSRLRGQARSALRSPLRRCSQSPSQHSRGRPSRSSCSATTYGPRRIGDENHIPPVAAPLGKPLGGAWIKADPVVNDSPDVAQDHAVFGVERFPEIFWPSSAAALQRSSTVKRLTALGSAAWVRPAKGSRAWPSD